MMRTYRLGLAMIGLMVLVGATAQAASWPSLPAACTPERAARWDANKNETMQASCHCPPPNLCPRTYEQWTNPALSPIPFVLARSCCNAPVCPDGTDFAGQPIPSDNQCNQPRCPTGTRLEGQVVPGDGNCNPSSSGGACEIGCSAPVPNNWSWCTATNNVNGNSAQIYSCENGNIRERGTIEGVCPPQYEDVCPNPSLDPGLCPAGTALAGQPMPSNGNCNPTLGCPDKFYQAGSTGIASIGLDYIPVGELPNNLASPAVITAIGTGNKVVGSSNPVNSGIQGAIIYYNYYVRPAGALETLIPGFLGTCRGFSADSSEEHIILVRPNGAIVTGNNTFGTHVGLLTQTINGRSCQYLTCTYTAGTRESTSCVTGDTLVTLVNGKMKKAEEVVVGDVLKGEGSNHAVVATNRYQQKDRVLYGINGSPMMISGFHPIRTTAGWKVIDPAEADKLAGKKNFAKDVLKLGDVLITEKGNVAVKAIETFEVKEPVSTYNIKVEGNAGFFANGIEVKGFDKMEMHYR